MRSLKLLALAAVLVVAVAAPAAAHVTVQPPEAAQGSYVKLALRVPNEEDTASTTKVEVQLPSELESARTRPLAGWTATVTGTTITWSGGRIEPGQFEEFEISVGPLPKVDELTFKAIQTYDNGDVVRWVEPTPADGTEPEHPAPVLHLTAATGEDDHGATTATTTLAAAPAAASDDGDDGKVVGAYALAVVALALAATAFVQVRRKPSGS